MNGTSKEEKLSAATRKKMHIVTLRVPLEDHEAIRKEAHERSLSVGFEIPYTSIYREYISAGTSALREKGKR